MLPAMPGFYHQPKSIADLVDFVVARIWISSESNKSDSPLGTPADPEAGANG